MEKILKLLYSQQDKEYGDFIHKLTPTLPRDYFIGIRVPDIRKLVPEISDEDKKVFLLELPHRYYEENMLHGFIISKMKDYDEIIKQLNIFLPYVDNWATSDTMAPKIFSKHHDKLISEIRIWIKSKSTYVVRFGILMLMNHYLEKDFKEEYFDLVSSIKSDEYYIKMMQAWYFATALVKQYETCIKIIESKKLDKWVHNKTIQKAIESYRIPLDKKEYLKTLKIK